MGRAWACAAALRVLAVLLLSACAEARALAGGADRGEGAEQHVAAASPRGFRLYGTRTHGADFLRMCARACAAASSGAASLSGASSSVPSTSWAAAGALQRAVARRELTPLPSPPDRATLYVAVYAGSDATCQLSSDSADPLAAGISMSYALTTDGLAGLLWP